MKKIIVVAWLGLLFTAIVALFWYNEWVYSLPTPVPQNYKIVKTGSLVYVPGKLNKNGKPLFLHFFNPDCPCSRFNIPHFKSLVKQYGEDVNFAIVPVITKGKYTAKEIQDRFQLDIPVLNDSTIAASCGVYSTPQAVIIDPFSQLYFRGNYNKSRYCTDEKTNYAKIALDVLVNGKTQPGFDQFALKAYGCSIPTCSTR